VLQVSVLGPPAATRAGVPLAAPAGRTGELLVRLALEAGAPVRTDRLIDDLWGSRSMRRNALQAQVARLRRALGDPAAVTHRDDAYALAVAPDAVDALQVLTAADAAARALAAGDVAGAAARGAAALALLPADLLPGAGDWAAVHRARLEEARARLLETSLDARGRLGEPGVLGALEAAVAAAPYQERLWELLMLALAAAGRQADALAAYRRARTRLADDLGLEPGPGLREAERRVLAQEVAPAPRAGNLPALAVELVGRGAELAQVAERLATHRLVELTGPGGVGKTALAIAAGRAAAPEAGTWLVRLEAAHDAAGVLDAVLAALDVTGGEPALLERLRRGGGLLVLDNCEHVADAAAALAERLLGAAPALRILATSQVVLGLDGGAVLELAPLALGDAVALFGRRAPRPGAAAEVEQLCRALDGLPLAIELAAARTRTLSLAQITRRLDDRFAVLSDPASRKPERRRALRATIGWSYDLLFPDDQRGLWALAAFTGGAPLDAAEAVLDALGVPAAAAIDVIGRLASRSLVIVEDGEGGTPRFRLLDSIRAFALDALAAAGLTATARDAHAAWYAAAAAASTAGVRSAAQADHLALARVERANIDHALAWCVAHDPTRALAIAGGFGWAWIVLGDSRGAERLLGALAAAGDAAPVRARAGALLTAGWIEASTGHLRPAREHVAAAAALAESADDDDLRARAAYHLAYVVSHDGAWEEALALCDRSHALHAGPGRAWDQLAAALFGARAAISAGDAARAAGWRDEVQARIVEVEDPWMRVRRDAMLGELARVEERFDDAVAHIAGAVETSGRLGFLQTHAYQMSCLGRAQAQAGDDARGAATLAEAAERAAAIGDVRMVALARVHLGRILRTLGRDAEARAALEAAAAWHGAAGGGEQAALGDALLAALDAAQGDPAALPRLEALLAAARASGDAPVEVLALDALARAAAGRGNDARAMALVRAADARMPAAAHFISPRDRTDRPAATSPEART
jgi:predicted ATPase/DNA-binding SARP family transcriptional activator